MEDQFLKFLLENLAQAFSSLGENADAIHREINELIPGGEVAFEQLPPEIQSEIKDLLGDTCSALNHLSEAINYGGEELRAELDHYRDQAIEVINAGLENLAEFLDAERQILFDSGLSASLIEELVDSFEVRLRSLMRGEGERLSVDQGIERASKFICAAEEVVNGEEPVSGGLKRVSKICKGATLVSADMAAMCFDFGTVSGLSVLSGSADMAEGAGYELPDETKPSYWAVKGLNWTRSAGANAVRRIRTKWLSRRGGRR